MKKQLNPMDKFDFLLGSWHLKYKVPKSLFSDEAEGEGTGEFKRVLNDKYVIFNYSAKLNSFKVSAEGIFAWDDKLELYRYWWFEDSGKFSSATCNFIDEDTLCLNWHENLFVQSFKKEPGDRVILRMKYPLTENKFDIILEVTFTRT